MADPGPILEQASAAQENGRRGVLRLLDSLAAYDAVRHPPVRTVLDYGLYRLERDRLPSIDGIRLTPGAASWLSVDFVDLPSRPECYDELEPVLGSPAEITWNAHQRLSP